MNLVLTRMFLMIKCVAQNTYLTFVYPRSVFMNAHATAPLQPRPSPHLHILKFLPKAKLNSVPFNLSPTGCCGERVVSVLWRTAAG